MYKLSMHDKNSSQEYIAVGSNDSKFSIIYYRISIYSLSTSKVNPKGKCDVFVLSFKIAKIYLPSKTNDSLLFFTDITFSRYVKNFSIGPRILVI